MRKVGTASAVPTLFDLLIRKISSGLEIRFPCGVRQSAIISVDGTRESYSRCIRATMPQLWAVPRGTPKAVSCVATICVVNPKAGDAFRGSTRSWWLLCSPCWFSGGGWHRVIPRGSAGRGCPGYLADEHSLDGGHVHAHAHAHTPAYLHTSPITSETVLLKHVVQPGETLGSIALQYGVSVDEISRPTT